MKIVWKQKPHYGGAEYSIFYFVLCTSCALLIFMAPACWARQMSSNRTLPKKQASRHSPEFYAKNIRSNLFTAPSGRKPVPTAAPNRKSAPLPIPSPTAPDPFTDWTYSGTVSIGDEKIALLENTKTHEGEYVRQGESFMGMQVGDVTDDGVTFITQGKPYVIAKSDRFNAVPLDKDAPFVDGEKTRATYALIQEDQVQSAVSLTLGRVGSDNAPILLLRSGISEYSSAVQSALGSWISATANDALIVTPK